MAYLYVKKLTTWVHTLHYIRLYTQVIYRPNRLYFVIYAYTKHMYVTMINKKDTTNLKVCKEGYMRSFDGEKGRGKWWIIIL